MSNVTISTIKKFQRVIWLDTTDDVPQNNTVPELGKKSYPGPELGWCQFRIQHIQASITSKNHMAISSKQ
jgi:hypothetical protein